MAAQRKLTLPALGFALLNLTGGEEEEKPAEREEACRALLASVFLESLCQVYAACAICRCSFNSWRPFKVGLQRRQQASHHLSGSNIPYFDTHLQETRSWLILSAQS